MKTYLVEVYKLAPFLKPISIKIAALMMDQTSKEYNKHWNKLGKGYSPEDKKEIEKYFKSYGAIK